MQHFQKCIAQQLTQTMNRRHKNDSSIQHLLWELNWRKSILNYWTCFESLLMSWNQANHQNKCWQCGSANRRCVETLHLFKFNFIYCVVTTPCFCSGHKKNTWFVFYSFCPVSSVLFSFLFPVRLPSLLSLHNCLASPSLAQPCSQCFPTFTWSSS